MTGAPHGDAELSLDVNDKVLAKIAAYEAVQTPGIARLHPYAAQAARNAVGSATKRATAKLTGTITAGGEGPAASAADPAAVDVDCNANTGAVTLTVRIVATTKPPIQQVINQLQQRISARITEITGTPPTVIVNVLDVDTSNLLS